MKIINVLMLASLLCACAPLTARKGEEPARNYPVFLQNGISFAAFKASADYDGQAFNALLTLKREGQNISVKLTGDFAATLLQADYDGASFTYAAAPAQLSERAKGVFEDIIKALTAAPEGFINATSADKSGSYKINFKNNGFLNRYYFKKGLSFPYRLEQIKVVINKVFLFDDYEVYGQNTLPQNITVRDAHALAQVKLKLLSVK